MRKPLCRALLACLLGVTTLQSVASGAPAPPVAASLESLGLKASGAPVREHPRWRAPRLIVVAGNVADQIPDLSKAFPQVKFVEIAHAGARDIAAADASVGVCSGEFLGKAQHLVWIQWLSAGVEGCVQQPLLHQRHIVLTNMQRTMGPSMAEHVIALMMALSRHLDHFLREQQEARWEPASPELTDLEGHTALVVGLGGIGTEVAKRAHALGMRVIATRASGREGPDYVSYVGLPDELLKLTREADYVINCAPLTPQTTGIFNQEFFASMKPTAYFINVGRGKSVVTTDLVAALRAKSLAGAGLDVVDPEPLPADSELWRVPNVIITPHVSAQTSVSTEQRLALLQENLQRYVAGDALLARVDIERGY
jgi:phosphoglycerate dehydrogenase-like enzyme